MQTEIQTKSFFREYWYVFFIVVMIAILAIAQILRSLTPNIPIQENTWEGITPGYSRLQDVKNKLGEPISQSQTELGTELLYKPQFESKLTQTVLLDKNEKVEFIKEWILPDERHTLEWYVEQFGPYDLKLHKFAFAPSVYAYIFLNKGVVIFAHISSNVVEEKWYFQPMSKEEFLSSWGEDLTDTGSVPEQSELAL